MLNARLKLHTAIECLENLGFDDYVIEEFKQIYEPVTFFFLILFSRVKRGRITI